MQRLLSIAVLGLAGSVPAAMAQAPEMETTQVGDGVYQFRYRAHNNFFVVTSDGIIAFDPVSGEAAEQYASEMRRVAPGKPLIAIVYSHDHADHVTGANVLRASFGDDIPVIAHENAHAKLVESASPDLPPPNLVFSDLLTLHFGGRTVELRYLGKSHSDNMIIAYLPEDKIVFAVDFVTNDGVGYRSLPDYHFPDFFNALERLKELDFQTIAFGHGPPGDKATIERQIRYYSDLRNAVTRARENRWSEDQAAERIRLDDYREWRGYENWFELNVRAIYRWLAEQAEGR